jgi:hypothetical protein
MAELYENMQFYLESSSASIQRLIDHCGDDVTEDKAVMRTLLDNIEKKFLEKSG